MDVIGRMYEHGERFWKANPHPTWVRLDGVTYHKTGIAPREMDPEVVPATARGAVDVLREIAYPPVFLASQSSASVNAREWLKANGLDPAGGQSDD